MYHYIKKRMKPAILLMDKIYSRLSITMQASMDKTGNWKLWQVAAYNSLSNHSKVTDYDKVYNDASFLISLNL
jgi:hypothetical protein